MIKIKENPKPTLPHTNMVCDTMLHSKLNKYDLTSFMNCHSVNLLIGRSRSGKTSLLHSLFEHRGLLRHCYNTVYLFMPVQSAASIKDSVFDKIPEDQIFHELTFDTLCEVKLRIEEDAAQGFTSCIIFDDFAADMKNKATLKLFKELVFNRRHLRLSMFFLIQTWFSILKDLRRLWTNIIVFKVSKNEMANIWDEVVEYDDTFMLPVMKMVFNEPYKFLFINLDSKRLFDCWDEILLEDD